ncbi:ferredoxin [Rhodococcus koreensis]
MRIEVNWETCVGHGVCEGAAPQVFEVDDDGELQVLVDGDIPDKQLPAVRKAAFACPEHALRLIKSTADK